MNIKQTSLTVLFHSSSKIISLFTILLIAMTLFFAPSAYATFHGKNGLIIFESDRGSPAIEDIYIMNADGTNQVNLTNSSTFRDITPKWSPDGKRIAFASNRTGRFEIYIMDPNGTNVMQITNGLGTVNAFPNWSPDGSKIAFISNRTAAVRELFVMNADGTNVQQLTFASQGQRASNNPIFTKDGRKIVFGLTNVAATVGTLNSINVDGTDLHQITDPSDIAAEEYLGDLSPNNAHIAYMDFAATDVSNIYVSKLKNHAGEFAPVSRADSQKITMDGNNNSVVFSPDGKYILIGREPGVIVSNVTFNDDLYVMKLLGDGSGVLINLTNANGAYRNVRADWQPLKSNGENDDE